MSSAYISNLSPQELKYNFDVYDRDGSGSIQISEMRDLFGRHGATISESAMQYLWNKYDKNKDGKIDFPEFVEYVTGRPWTGGQIPHAPHTWAHFAHLGERNTTSAQPQAQMTTAALESTLSFQQEFHKGFLEGYSKGYNEGLQKFLSQGPRPQGVSAAPTIPAEGVATSSPVRNQTGATSPAPVQAPAQTGGFNWNNLAKHVQHVGTVPSNWQQPPQPQPAAPQVHAPMNWQQNLAHHVNHIGQPAPQQVPGVQQPMNWQQNLASHVNHLGQPVPQGAPVAQQPQAPMNWQQSLARHVNHLGHPAPQPSGPGPQSQVNAVEGATLELTEIKRDSHGDVHVTTTVIEESQTPKGDVVITETIIDQVVAQPGAQTPSA